MQQARGSFPKRRAVPFDEIMANTNQTGAVNKSHTRPHAGGAFVPIPLTQLNRLHLKQDVRQFFLGAGLRFNKAGETGLWLRSDGKTTSFLEAVALQNTEGELLPDAQERLDPDKFGSDRGVAELMQHQIELGLQPPTALTKFQVDLLSSQDPLASLNEVAQRSRLSLWAIKTTDAFRRRLMLFEIFEYLRTGNDPTQFRERPRVRNPVVSGLVELQPASIVSTVLAARGQPLVAVLLTPFLSQVVLVPRHGSFVREVSVQPWPVAFTRISLFGADPDAYHTPVRTLPDGHGEAALLAIVAGGNRLFTQLTQPEMWSDDGTFDFDGRLLTWSSIRFGLDAITALAADWTSHEAVWTAFRAVTILQGIWQCQLSELLNPDRLDRYAVPVLFDATERSLATGLIANYRQTLSAAFPGRAIGNVAVKLAQIRNLVHGMRAEGQDPLARLEVLRSVEKAGPSLELIRDVAALWWTAVLLSPETHARPGRPPWMRRPNEPQA
jgi:hypothetical protein